jgi:hypothetical protein
VLRSIGGHEQRFGPTVEIYIFWVGKNCSQKSTDTGATWLARDDRIEVFT